MGLPTTRMLRQFLEQPQGNYPIARMPRDLQAALGAGTREVQLSEATMRKQRVRHPELTHADYEAAAAAIADPDVVLREDRRHVKMLKVIGGSVLAVVKTTARADENYVVSVFRPRLKDVRKLLRRHPVISGSPASFLAAAAALSEKD